MHSLLKNVVAWLRLARLHFYPPVAVLYAVGALAAGGATARLEGLPFALGALYLLLVLLATSMANDYVDHASDAANSNAGPFSGGSRILVDGRLGFAAVRAAVAIAVFAAVLLAGLLAASVPPAVRTPVVFLLLLGLVLGLGYTLPPLKLCYRGLGEPDVAFMHSGFATVLGWTVQGGHWRDLLPWALALPTFFAVLAAISLAGIPDRAADAAAGKRTWSVRFGSRTTASVALVAAMAAGGGGLWLAFEEIVRGPGAVLLALAAIHALVVLVALVRFIRAGAPEGRIDALMVNVLVYTLWFGVAPLVGVGG